MTVSVRRAPFPDIARLLCGFAVAPIAAAACMAATPHLGGNVTSADIYFRGLILFTAFALPLGLLIGGPLFFAVWRFGFRPTLLNCLICGGVCALLATVAAFLPFAWSGITSENLDGALELRVLFAFIPFIVAGFAAGFAFWLCVIWRDPRYRS